MSEELKSNIEYPQITIGGQQYTVRLTLATMMKLESEGTSMPLLQERLRKGEMPFSTMVKIIGTVLDWPGDPYELAKQIDMRDFNAVCQEFFKALGKVLPSVKTELQGPGAAATETVQ
jgi:Phage tail tube protein, GTA-gp10